MTKIPFESVRYLLLQFKFHHGYMNQCLWYLWSSISNLNEPRLRCVGSRYPTWKQQNHCTNSCGKYSFLRLSALSVLIFILPSSTSVYIVLCQPTPIQAAPPFTPHHHHIKSNLSLPYLIASKRIQRSKPSSCPSTILMTSTKGVCIDGKTRNRWHPGNP